MSANTEYHSSTPPGSTQSLPARVRDWLSPPAQFSLVEKSAERRELKFYITDRFQREYSAKVSDFMPNLVRMNCCGKISAAVGVRCASEGRLFVEQYLDKPIESVVGLPDSLTQRSRIAELGNLVASHRGASRLLFLTIANSLLLADIDWVVFAATRQVGKLVAKFPCDTFHLGAADPACLGEAARKWGSYYATDPQLLAIYLPLARKQVEHSPVAALTMRVYSDACANLARQLKAAFYKAALKC